MLLKDMSEPAMSIEYRISDCAVSSIAHVLYDLQVSPELALLEEK
jgi:hypothetical protein